MSSIRKANPNTRPRRKNSKRNQPFPAPAVRIVEATASGTLLTLTFDQSISLNGTPQILTDLPSAEPVSAVRSAPNTIKITYSEAIDTAEELIVPYREASVRTSEGGYVADSTFPLAA